MIVAPLEHAPQHDQHGCIGLIELTAKCNLKCPLCFADAIRLAKTKNFKYIMLNTNGIKIAQDEDFTRQLQEFVGGFEVYLQFDRFKETTYNTLRGKNLLPLKKKALENLSKYKIPTTLVSTLAK